MSARGWSARIVLRYTILQVPAVALLVLILILLRRWMDLPAWFVWGLVGLWVAKDVVLFPFVWRAYGQQRGEDTRAMVGAQGTVEDRLSPSGYVRVHGELWQPEVMGGGYAVDRGKGVRIQAIHGLTLLVEPVNEEING
ncbi:MAG: hypothetical protein GTO24_28295 [candidate division Zixibacteria bacterium]|nr:hypothetical protein [candidate division Zixibacteria bacterium]